MNLSTPLLWVVFPVVIAAISGIVYRRDRINISLTGLTTLSLALLAAFFPEDMTLRIGSINLTFQESLGILGRQISVSYEVLPFIAFIYAMNCLWVFSSTIPGVPMTFRPSSLVITGLLTAALGVEPFLYAALLIQTAILVSIPMLSPLNVNLHPGILRYVSFQTLALPLILLAGWLLTGVETLPADSPLVGQSMMLLGLGFAIWLSVFPFHSWVPMVSEKSQSTVTGYLLFIIPTTILLFSLNFFNRFTFLRASENLFEILRLFGVLMIAIGGSFTAIQNDLKRAFGFSILTETGFSLLSIGLAASGGLDWMLALFPARALGLLLWSYTMALIENHAGSTKLKALHGFAQSYPILSIGVILAQFSIGGLPLLASFPIKGVLITSAFKTSPSLGIWSLLGGLGLFIFSLRLLFVLVIPEEDPLPIQWRISEEIYEYLPTLILILVLILLGLFPNAFLTDITRTLSAFSQLQ
jgi:NADH:ubiquinone oxidoreductase subunit 2 (subunit N)